MISVIIPTYNTPINMTERCIRSVLDQSFTDFECIVVDDGSTPAIAASLDELMKLDSRIKVFHKENFGAGHARSYGVNHSGGEFVFFVDSDDYISPYALENAFDVYLQTNADMVIGGIEHVYPTEEPDFKKIIEKQIVIQSEEQKSVYIQHISNYKQKLFFLKRGATGVSVCSKLIKKECALKVQFENDKFWDEDNLWNISAVSVCDKLVVVDNLWYAYVINPDSSVRSYKGDRTYEFQYRAKQEYDLINRLYPDGMQSAYYMIWDGLLRYCRTDTFNKKNPYQPKTRYENFCKAIDFSEFNESMINIDFNNENRIVFRLVKKTVQSLLKLKNKRAAYVLLYICIKKIKY